MTISRWVALMSCLCLLAGCSGDKPTSVVTPADGLPAGTPINDSVDHLLARFVTTFEWKSNVEYAKLLTDDFRFHFSAASDPNLVATYGDFWGRTDEDTSITHLFKGFTRSDVSAYVPAPISIQMVLNGVQVVDDTSHVDSVAFYRKVIVSIMQADIEVPTTGDPVSYEISSREEFYLVRGDAAVLGPGQEARSDRWYLRGWDDLSPGYPYGKGPVINPTRTHSIGSIKALYR